MTKGTTDSQPLREPRISSERKDVVVSFGKSMKFRETKWEDSEKTEISLF